MMKLHLRRILATEARLVNELLADPDIAAGALGTSPSAIDLVPFISDERNIALVTEDDQRATWGAVLFHWQEPGVYEVHTMAKRAVRGAAYVRAVRDALRLMFLSWDTMELWTRVPQGNDAALGLVRLVGGRRMFATRDVARDAATRDVATSNEATYYLLRWEEWLWSPGGAACVERGKWFHDRLQAQFAEQKREHELHDDNPDHDRAVGATCELVLNGLVEKGIVLYNRWAKLAGFATITVVVPSPLVMNIGDALLQVDFAQRDFLLLEIKPGDLRVEMSRPAMNERAT